MKKALSILLATLLLTTALGVGATATPVDHSLQFQLPIVTAIDAAWNGEVLIDDWLQPVFTAENVEVTVHFQDGTSEVLEHFYDNASNWSWEIQFTVDFEAELVIVRYTDSNSMDRFMDEHDICGCEIDLEAYLAWLPQTTFAFPGNFLDDILAAFPTLTLDETATFADGDMFTFIPENTGLHHFFSSGDQDLAIFNTNMELIWFGEIFSTHRWAQVQLTVGETYLVQLWAWGGTQNITVSETAPAPGGGGGSGNSWLQNLVNNLLWLVQHTPGGRFLTVLLFPIMLPVLGLLRLVNWIYTGRW
ncbi:MAG: hypothetical protein FWD06_09665 [Oscillospiraceae bacterium]|nr:hypothetical protein [Oscillospiraceae bacterium]